MRSEARPPGPQREEAGIVMGNKLYLYLARREAVRIAIERGEVTAEDLRKRLAIPANVHPNTMGMVFLSLLKDGLLKRCGHARASWSTANAHHLRRWRPTEKAAAWLAQTPELEGLHFPEQTEFKMEGAA